MGTDVVFNKQTCKLLDCEICFMHNKLGRSLGQAIDDCDDGVVTTCCARQFGDKVDVDTFVACNWDI